MDAIVSYIKSNYEVDVERREKTVLLTCRKEICPQICNVLFERFRCIFSGIVVDRLNENWLIFYIFLKKGERFLVQGSLVAEDDSFISISPYIHGADWHEREIEDLFEFRFEGHPRLGNFVLHDDVWPEGIAPMRQKDFPGATFDYWEDISPERLLDAPGAFIMPIGPIFSGEHESVHFQIETIGEEIVRCYPRLFYKFRAIEKKAQGMEVDRAILLSERIAGKCAFAHALGFCQAVEEICGVEVPPRAKVLRMFLSELERIRHHIGVLEGICSSTGLWVAASQLGMLEEKMLRLSCELTGHRYFFGMAICGGVSRDIENDLLSRAIEEVEEILSHLKEIETLLISTSSFLDRIEEVGVVGEEDVLHYGMVGPVARASGWVNDIRVVAPYLLYGELNFGIPTEIEGDGYARFRVFSLEIEQSLNILTQLLDRIKYGEVKRDVVYRQGWGLGIVEAPGGSALHWVRLDRDGKIARYRIITPSFMNWHGFHNAVEGFAFQDFPIILATFGLDVAENDR